MSMHQNIQYPTLTPLPQMNNHLYHSQPLISPNSDIHQSSFQSNFSSPLNQLIKTENGTHTNLTNALHSEIESGAVKALDLELKSRQLLTNIESR